MRLSPHSAQATQSIFLSESAGYTTLIVTFTKLIGSFHMLKISTSSGAHTAVIYCFHSRRKFHKLSRNEPPCGSQRTFVLGNPSLSTLLQNGFRFFHNPIPASHRRTLRLPTLFVKEEYGLTTFPLDNLSDDLGSAYSPVALLSVCTEAKALHPGYLPFWSKRISVFRLLHHHDV